MVVQVNRNWFVMENISKAIQVVLSLMNDKVK